MSESVEERDMDTLIRLLSFRPQQFRKLLLDEIRPLIKGLILQAAKIHVIPQTSPDSDKSYDLSDEQIAKIAQTVKEEFLGPLGGIPGYKDAKVYPRFLNGQEYSNADQKVWRNRAFRSFYLFIV
jgi:hypothetical protein